MNINIISFLVLAIATTTITLDENIDSYANAVLRTKKEFFSYLVTSWSVPVSKLQPAQLSNYHHSNTSYFIVQAAEMAKINSDEPSDADSIYMYEWPTRGELILIENPDSGYNSLMMVSDIDRHLVISAFKTNESVFLIEAPLSTFFKDISTYEELVVSDDTEKPITLLNLDGSIAAEKQKVKIVRFARD